jgi:hypothetical protein
MRQISIVNQSTTVPPAEFAAAVAALQVQLDRDFAPAWNLSATLAANGTTAERVYILDDTTQADALGYHDVTSADVPVGFVFAKTDQQYGVAWASTLSHEVLEQLADPQCNLTAMGHYGSKLALFAYEVADGVENDEYQINGVTLSNFVLPSWFQDGFRGRVDFMGRLSAAFTLSPGGYISYQTKLGTWQQWYADRTPHRQRWPERYSRRHQRLRKAAVAEALRGRS